MTTQSTALETYLQGLPLILDNPPDLQNTAVQTVLQQAEALSSGWSDSLRPVRNW